MSVAVDFGITQGRRRQLGRPPAIRKSIFAGA
jgi:hypothetical protein